MLGLDFHNRGGGGGQGEGALAVGNWTQWHPLPAPRPIVSDRRIPKGDQTLLMMRWFCDTRRQKPESSSYRRGYLPVQIGASHAIGFSGSALGASPPPAFQTRTKKYLLTES